jgi:hypothetical protein
MLVNGQALESRRTPAGLSLQWVKPEDDDVLENALNALKSSQGQTGKVMYIRKFKFQICNLHL